MVTKELVLNTLLAALAAGVGAFVYALEVTPAPTTKAAAYAALVGAGYAAVRAFVGVIAAKVNRPISVDK